LLFKIGSALIANKFIAGVAKREKYSSLGTYPLGISFENINLILKLFAEKFLRKLSPFNRTKFNFEGKNSIPIMTIHKSKGLEYDTIFFVGLEDSAFWNFKNQPDEDRCAFFVALSRAKRRIDFTFSSNRPTKFSNIQKHDCINEFYELFKNTGIVKKIEY